MAVPSSKSVRIWMRYILQKDTKLELLTLLLRNLQYYSQFISILK
jgi:hypothetical protein